MKTISLKDFVEINPRVRLSRGEIYPFVPMTSLEPGRRYIVASEVRESGGGAKFCGGDTLFARITPCLENGKIAQFKAPPTQKAFGSTEYWVFRAKENVSDPNFVFYLCMTDLVRKPAEKSMSGASGRQRADVAAIYEVQVPYFDLDSQRRIASILSAYDDLIDNNTRRIEILEEMARRLYEEWFVHYRFPWHEEVSFKESELGRIPEGWAWQPIGEIYTTSSGGTPSRKKSEYYGDDHKWVKTKELRDCPIFETEEMISDEGLRNSSAKLFPKDTVIIAMYGATIGRLGILQEEAATNQACCAIIPKEGYGWAFAYLSLLHRRKDLIDLRAGAAQQNISQAIIKKLPILAGDQHLQSQFENLVSPILKLSYTLHSKNANLRDQRDLLIPKLVSGEIDVSDIPLSRDKEVKAA